MGNTSPNRQQVFKSTWNGSTWTNPSSSDNISLDDRYAHTPQVAVNSTGDFAVITWTQSTSPYSSLSYSSVYQSTWNGSTWTEASRIGNGAFPSGVSMSKGMRPKVAVNSAGTFAVIMWQQNIDNTDYLQIYRSTWNGSAWSEPASPFEKLYPNGQDAGDPQVTVNSAGDFAVITWRRSFFEIFQSIWDGSTWTTPGRLK